MVPSKKLSHAVSCYLPNYVAGKQESGYHHPHLTANLWGSCLRNLSLISSWLGTFLNVLKERGNELLPHEDEFNFRNKQKLFLTKKNK